jgi:hypothetical protein
MKNGAHVTAGKVLGGEDYLLQMTIPNTFFHVAMAYAADSGDVARSFRD